MSSSAMFGKFADAHAGLLLLVIGWPSMQQACMLISDMRLSEPAAPLLRQSLSSIELESPCRLYLKKAEVVDVPEPTTCSIVLSETRE